MSVECGRRVWQRAIVGWYNRLSRADFERRRDATGSIMRVDAARPDVGTLVFRLFSRSVHPELFDVLAHTTVRQEHYSAALLICDAGHVVAFHHSGQSLCEVPTRVDRRLARRR